MKLRRSGFVKLKDLALPAGARKDLDEETLEALEKTLKRGEPLPPLTVAFEKGRGMRLVCGRHRWEAARRAKVLTMRADIFEFDTKAEERLQVIRENLDRKQLGDTDRDALRLEKKRLVEADFKEATVPRVAGAGGRPVSPSRAAIKTIAEDEGVSESAIERSVKRAEAREVDPRDAEQPPPAQVPSIPAFEMAGIEYSPDQTAEVLNVVTRLDKAAALVSQALGEVTRCETEMDIAGHGKTYGMLRGQLQVAAAAIRAERPAGACRYCGCDAVQLANCPGCGGLAWLTDSQLRRGRGDT